MANLSPLLVKKHRGKSRKYISTDVTSPYATLDKTHSRQKSIKDSVGNVVAPKVCHQYEEALRRRDFRQVLWMITNGNIHANYETKSGETALLAAVSAKNLDALAILMTSGVSIDTSNRQGYTPLMKAIAVAVPRYNSLPKTISPSNNNMEESTHSGASVNVHENEIVANVLKYEPNLLQTDKSGRTAFDWAKLTGNVEALEWLEKRQREKSMKHQSAANRQERVAQCLELLNQHEGYIRSINDLIAPQFFGEEALVTFLKSTRITSAEFARALSDLKDMEDIARSRSFQSQFFVNIETREGWTPLAKCAAFGYVAAVQELLAMGADLHYETRLRHTAMTWASYCGHEAVVLHLLRIGVNVDQKTRDGKTALMHAVSNSQAKIVHHLLIATRDQCFPTKPIETFSSEIDLKVSKLKFGHRPKEVKTIETEWHAVFLKKIRWKDQTGKDAVELAQVALEQAQLLSEDGSSSYRDEAAIQVLHQTENVMMSSSVQRVVSSAPISSSGVRNKCFSRIESTISVFTVEKDLWNADFCVEPLYVLKN
ncbi:hypothetical protein DVH05_009338 [Phytophthora capsici]|nr:hypothetical protein DVH05_009338 [Phytophthora capsici]